VQAAFNYAEAFSSEICEALAENEATSFTTIKRMLPGPSSLLRDERRNAEMLNLPLDEHISPDVARACAAGILHSWSAAWSNGNMAVSLGKRILCA
jgi:hypothetical protein